MSCHLWHSLVLFSFVCFYHIFIFFSFNIFHRSRLCGVPGLWHDFCVQICPHAFSFESIFDFGLNSWPNQLIPGDIGVFWVRDDCVLSFALFWGGMTPTALLTYCGTPLQISALCTTSTPPATAILWVAAPPSLPCSPPSSCLDYFLLSQASPLHRDRLRSHDDGGMHSCGRSLFELTKGAKASNFFSQSLFHLDLRVQEWAGSQHNRYLNTSRVFLFYFANTS